MSKVTDFIKQHYKVLIISVFFVSVLPFIVISFYSRPCADDYNVSIDMIRMVEQGKVNVFSILKTAFITDIKFYKGWNGLYTSGFLLAFQPGAYLGERNYYAGVFVLMALIFFSLYYAIRTVYRIFEIDRDVFLSASILFSFFLHGMISTVQGLYWFCGSYNYLPFLMLTMINAVLMLRYFNLDEKDDNRLILISAVISFVNSGGNHITSFLNILILFVYSVYALWKKKKYGVIASLFSAIGGFLLVVFAPGTRVRMNEFDTRSPITTIIITAKKAVSLVFSKEYVLNIRFLILIFIVTILAFCVKNNRKIKSFKLHPIILFLIFAMLFCAMLAVPYHAMGSFGAGRVKNIVWFTFNILSGILWGYTLIWISKTSDFFNRMFEKTMSFDKRVPLLISCILLILFSKNMYSIIGELKNGSARTYAEQYERRYELMKEYRGSDEIIEVDRIIESPNLKFDDISSDLNDWRNKSWSSYYQVKTILKD